MGEKLIGKVHFCYLSVRSGSLADMACVFVTKTIAVRIFQSVKLIKFGRNFFPIVQLFRLGAADSNKVSFYLSIRVKIM